MLLPQLEQQGLIHREGDARDKRIMRLFLTREGDAKLMQALEVYTAIIDHVMAQSTPAQCEALGEQMRRIEDVLSDPQ